MKFTITGQRLFDERVVSITWEDGKVTGGDPFVYLSALGDVEDGIDVTRGMEIYVAGFAEPAQAWATLNAQFEQRTTTEWDPGPPPEEELPDGAVA